MKCQATYAAGLGRIWQGPSVFVAQISDLRTGAPILATVVRDEDPRRFRAGKLEVGDARVERHPSNMPDGQPIARFAPGRAQVIRAKDAVGRPSQDDTLAGNDTRYLVIRQTARGFAPTFAFAFTDHHAFFGCENQVVHENSILLS